MICSLSEAISFITALMRRFSATYVFYLFYKFSWNMCRFTSALNLLYQLVRCVLLAGGAFAVGFAASNLHLRKTAVYHRD